MIDDAAFDSQLAAYLGKPPGSAPVDAKPEPVIDQKPAKDQAPTDDGSLPADDQPLNLTDAEVRARALGWSPDKEAFEKSGKHWTDAETFLRTRDMADEISRRGKENKNLQKEMQRLLKNQEMLIAAEVERRVNSLTQQRRDAIKAQDVEEVERLDGEIQKAKDLHSEPATPNDDDDADNNPTGESVEQLQAAAQKWKAENPWFDKSSAAIQRQAHQYELAYRASHPGCSTEQALSFVSQSMMIEFPELKAWGQPLPSAGAPRNKSSTASAAFSPESLKGADRSLYQALKRGGHFRDAKHEQQWLKETLEG